MNTGQGSRWTTSLLREHPALILTALYVASSVIGMFYSWSFLRQFGINVFLFAQLSDFLIASLREPFTWALAILAIALVLFDNSLSRRVEQRGPPRWLRWYGSARYRMINTVVAIYIVFTFLYLFAAYQAKDTRDGEGQRVDVMLADGGDARNALLLGTTGQYVFLYDADAARVDIHPVESIRGISFTVPGTGDGRREE